MQKVLIQLDEEKLIKEGYNPVEAYDLIDDLFVEKNIEVENADKERLYAGKGSKDDFSSIWIVNLALNRKKWFKDSVVKWLYFNSDGRANPDSYLIEDIKEIWADFYE